ncbi:MAG: triose-phosphate isomerase [Candidatus Spechtbacteria bacterium]|nr:triose-phosphate isomerase [Candidatus Spechtbacteria bacterium]
MKQFILVANWKMNPITVEGAQHLWNVVSKGIDGTDKTKVVVCPPFSYLHLFSSLKGISLGAQDCFWQQEGAYTGEVSPKMLVDLGCEYVIVGHSERREYAKEDNQIVNKKVKAALDARLHPILAIGEKIRETFDSRGKHTNELDRIVERQLVEGVAGVPKSRAEQLLIAYEPVWAIGTGIAAESNDVFTAVLFIRKILSQLYSRSIADRIPVLYGGSTDSKNLTQFLQEGNADGALVGGSSINASEFLRMIKVAEEITGK